LKFHLFLLYLQRSSRVNSVETTWLKERLSWFRLKGQSSRFRPKVEYI